MQRYVIRSFDLASVAKFGLALGLLVNLLPACLCGLTTVRAVATLHQFLEGAAQSRLTFFGQTLSLNLVEMAHLGPALETARALDGLGWSLAIAVGLTVALSGALIVAVTSVLAALGYNALASLTGGLEFALEAAPFRLVPAHQPNAVPSTTSDDS